MSRLERLTGTMADLPSGFCDHWWYLNGHLVYSFSRENRVDGSVFSVPVLINGDRDLYEWQEKRMELGKCWESAAG